MGDVDRMMLTNLIGKDHEPIIGFTTQDPSDTLGRMPHSIERQIIIFSNWDRIGQSSLLVLLCAAQVGTHSGSCHVETLGEL